MSIVTIVIGQTLLLLASAITTISEVRKAAQDCDSRGLELDYGQGLGPSTADCQVLSFYHTVGVSSLRIQVLLGL